MPTDVRATGKSRSQRINIDYYRQENWLTRSRGYLALAAAMLAVGYGLYVFTSGGPSHLSTGPVAMAHASFENDCQQCHLPFTPISGDALRFTSNRSLDRLEETCQKCHRVNHHFRGSMKPEFAAIDQHCSGCHTDHQGRNHDMSNVASTKCTQCHGDLPSTCMSPSSIEVRTNITAFTADAHGDFPSLQKGDPGRVKFDHGQHMMPGQVDPGVKGGFLISMLEPHLKNKYRKTVDGTPQSDDAMVTLSCADCHKFAGASDRSLVGDDEIGRHIEPISFDQHCAACHSLNVAGRTEDTLPLPHAAPWKEVETLIASKLVGGQQLGSIRLPRDAARKTPLVGEGYSGAMPNLSSLPSGDDEEDSIISASVRAGLASVAQRCLQCHMQEDITDESIRSLRAGDSPPLIPERWLKRGIYDHAAHRKIDCAYCHANAYPKATTSAANAVVSNQTAVNRDASIKKDDSQIVMIGGIETCTGCHRDASSSVPDSMTSEATKTLLGGQGTWASDACIECHRYHWQRPPSLAAEQVIPQVATLEDRLP
jgi:hypothetical protein